MIDSEFIIAYTNALYSTPLEIRPSYDEFRDMFSLGQIKSKEWAIDCLDPFIGDRKTAVVVGAWYGTLGMFLHRSFPQLSLTLLDIDPRCSEFIDSVFRNTSGVKAVTQDMYQYSYSEDVVINTSCEHIESLDQWLKLLPKGTLVLLQSNNADTIDGHINCSKSIDDFLEKSKLTTVLYSRELEMPMYTRYMIIGVV